MSPEEEIEFQKARITEISGDLATLNKDIQETRDGIMEVSNATFEGMSSMAEAFNALAEQVHLMGKVVERLSNGEFRAEPDRKSRWKEFLGQFI